MSEYIRHNWAPGEEITSGRLNNMEQGITEGKKAAEDSASAAKAAQEAANKHAARHAKGSTDPITLEMLGAAPSGYGLGDICTTQGASAITKTGWYKGSIGSVTGDTWGAATDFWIIRHIEHGVRNEATQKAWMPACYGNCSIERVRSEGVWGEWEWVNPPMSLGVEYRTTERWNGKLVYVKRVSLGSLPNNSEKTVSYEIIGYTPVSHEETFVSTSGWKLCTHPDIVVIPTGDGFCTIKTTADFSMYTGYATLKYVYD